MNTNRITVREARRGISKILTSGQTIIIGKHYGELRGFVVPVPLHNSYDQKEKRKALKAAKAAFQAAFIEEWNR
jgi:hypothetical protein